MKKRILKAMLQLGRPRIVPGSAPGTLQVPDRTEAPRISLIAYGPDATETVSIDSLNDVARFRERYPVVWVNVDGLGDPDRIQEIGDHFSIHRLALEDAVNVPQRPKVESYDGNLFAVLRMPPQPERERFEQLSLLVMPGLVLTLQETRGDCLDPLRQRIAEGRKTLRSSGSDYLAWAIMDSVVDSYFPVIEELGKQIEVLEERVIDDPFSVEVTEIYQIKHDLQALRKLIWPQREAVAELLRDEYEVVQDATIPYLRDCLDHATQLLDFVGSFRDSAGNLLDLHLSAASHRLNETMRLLTIIATIFIPLSFIAGIYGMNFDSGASPWNMPELHWAFGYPVALGLMAIVAAAMLIYMKSRRWF